MKMALFTLPTAGRIRLENANIKTIGDILTLYMFCCVQPRFGQNIGVISESILGIGAFAILNS
jgi:hypothetical protein